MQLKDYLTRFLFVELALLMAALAIVSGFYAEPIAVKLGVGLAFAKMLPHLLADAAIILTTAEIVERTLLAKFNKDADGRHGALGTELKKKVEEVLQLSFDDNRYAAHYDVHFRPARRSEVYANVSYEEMAEAIREAEWLKVFSTSGRDIFSNERATKDSFAKRIKEAPIDIAVFSCKPIGEKTQKNYAWVRGELESPGNPHRLSDDVRVAFRNFKDLVERAMVLRPANHGRFRWFSYDFVPQGWFFLTDKVGFAEIYHFGLAIRQGDYDASCAGGRVPLLKFTQSADLYKALKEYLEYLAGDDFTDNPVAQEHRKNFFKIECHLDSQALQPDA